MFPGFGMHGPHRAKMFERGALKYLILDMINTKPRHGYDIIREFEESSGSFYSPSAGVVYPTLQMLEDLGQVRAKEEDGKKVYEITDEGRAFLETHKDRVKQHRERMAEHFGAAAPRASMMRDMKVLFRVIVQTVSRGGNDPGKLAAIREVLAKARKDIDEIVGT